MFVKVTTNSVGQKYYHLVESYRENGKVRQRILLSLGRAEEGKLEALGKAIDKHRQTIEAFDLAKGLCVSETFTYGPLVLLKRLFEKLGIEEILRDLQRDHKRLKFDFVKTVFTLVAARFIRPSSKLFIYDQLLERMDPEFVDAHLPLHQIYRTLNILNQHKEELETGLYLKGRDLFNISVDVVLYDLTTLRFESIREDLGELRRFGYSKEMRTDCTQVVLGLLVDPQGVPLGFEVYPGNTFEGKTLSDIVEKMRKKFKVRRFIFVADRGLFSKKNLENLREEKGQFIVGMKLGLLKKRAQEFYDLSRFEYLNEKLAIYETTHDGDRLIVTWSKARAERDHKKREDILKKIRKKLSKKTVSAKTFVSNRSYQRFVKGLAEGERPCLDEVAILEDARHDGFFGVVTNVPDFAPEQVVQDYKQLWKIEDAFGELKGTLKARPVFHWKDDRIVGHLVVCFLSYLCEAHMTQALRQKKKDLDSKSIGKKIIKPRPLTVVQAMEELKRVRSVPITVGEKTIWVRTDIAGQAAKLFQALGVAIPPKALRLEPCPAPKSVVAQGPRSPATL